MTFIERIIVKSLFLFITLLFNLPAWAAANESQDTIQSQTAHSQDRVRLCAVYPHLKDSYWLSINFGMIKQAKQRAIKLKVLEAGGYGNSDSQWQQIEHCRKWQADAILFGSVLFDPFSEQLGLINRHTPLFSLVNEVDKVELTASIGVS
ncbi:MAG: TMAO reductase system protein TorT, partial [Moritella sp.]|nr:TMAO reductase system protein TorT [Moritella sp.]